MKTLCPCCRKYVPDDLESFQAHFQSCLEKRENEAKVKDSINQARIELNAAVDKFNKTMNELGVDETATVNYRVVVNGEDIYEKFYIDFIN